MIPLGVLAQRQAAAGGDPLDAFTWAWRFESPSITGLAHGDYVNTWVDTSGNSRHATRSGATCTWDATAFGGVGGVFFPDVAGGQLRTGIISAISQPVTVWVVTEPPTRTNAFLFDGAESGARLAAYFPSASTTSNLILFAGGTVQTVSTVTKNNGNVWAFRFDGASSRAWAANGTTGTVSATPGSHALTGLTLGGHVSVSSNSPTSAIGAILVAAGSQSTADMNAIGNALAGKYNQTWTDIA